MVLGEVQVRAQIGRRQLDAVNGFLKRRAGTLRDVRRPFRREHRSKVEASADVVHPLKQVRRQLTPIAHRMDAGIGVERPCGVRLGDFVCAPAKARVVSAPPGLWPRDPPIRVHKAIPTAWLELTLTEGKNRQVRRMTAAVGLPTLRLIRYAIGPWTLDGLAPGTWRSERVGAHVL